MDQIIQAIAVNAIPLLFAITLHEVAHGWVAGKLGDPTARMMGRITLNPLAHIDPFGTIILPLLQIAGGTGTLFGWAKPVPVNFNNLRRPRRDTWLVAAAGPGSNAIQFLFWCSLILIIRATIGFPPDVYHLARTGLMRGMGGIDLEGAGFLMRMAKPVLVMSFAGLIWNYSLGVLNLLPILPLDGGRMLNSLLPWGAAQTYSRLEPYGFFVLIAVLYLFSAQLGILFVPFYWILGLILG